ncbi:MAG: L-histidine N(alpha)-methyltransferase [Candidatus Binatia bacterium]
MRSTVPSAFGPQLVRVASSRRDGWALDLAHSANLYLTDRQAHLYESVRSCRSYRRAVAEPLRQSRACLPTLLELVRRSAEVERPLVLFDCGPGDPEDAVALASALAARVRLARYVIVDVNDTLLDETRTALQKAVDVTVETRSTAFERFSLRHEKLAADVDVVLFFGATGLNYQPRALARLLNQMGRAGTLVALQSLLVTPEQTPAAYSERRIRSFVFEPIRLLGGNEADFRFGAARRDDRIDLEFVALRKIRLGRDNLTLVRGDVVRTAFSRRQSWSSLGAEVANLFGDPLTLVRDGLSALILGELKGA